MLGVKMSSFQETFFRSNALTADKIKVLKELLVSQVEEERQYALEVVDEYAGGDEVNIIMKSDLITLLCDNIASGAKSSNCLIYGTLTKLCRQECFYSDGHALTIGQIVCRHLKFLIKEPMCVPELEVALYLVSNILKGYGEFKFEPDKNYLEHVNGIIQSLTTGSNSECNSKILLCSSMVLCSFLSIENLKLKESTGRVLFENLRRCFSGLFNRHFSVDPLIERTIEVACSLSDHMSRFLLMSSGETELLFMSSDEQADTIRMISDFAVTVALPYIMKLPQQDIRAFPEKVTSIFKSLSLLLEEAVTGQNWTLAHALCETGLLPYIIQLLPLATERGKLRGTCLNLLTSLLVTLSLDIFRFPLMWIEGEEHFRAQVSSGVQSLPDEPQLWFHALCDPSQHRSVVLVILLYLFFFMLVEGNFGGNDTFIAISEFLDQVVGLGSCPLLLKIVWLVFALSQVNVPDEELAEGLEPAVVKLFGLLQQQSDLELVYTHHPGLLYHAFHSEKFPRSLQLQLVRLWLKNESKSGETLTELLKTSERARFAVLDLVLSSEEPLLSSATDAYGSLLVSELGDEQAATVWHLLPNALSKICGNAIPENNVERLVELALRRKPQVLDPLEMTRAAGLVPAAISCLTRTPLPMWNLAHQILTQHIEQMDFRVVTYFVRSTGFIDKLLHNLKVADSAEVTQTSLKIATLLNLVQRTEIDILKIQCSVQLDPNSIVSLLQAPEADTRRRALLFIQELLDSKWVPSICCLGEPPSSKFICYLVFLLQNYCIEESSDEVWECLGSCLRLFPPDHPITMHLANHDPWLPHLLQIRLPLLCHQQAMLSFVYNWLSLYRPPSLTSRRLNTPIHLRVLALIAEELKRSANPTTNQLLLKIVDMGIDIATLVPKETPLEMEQDITEVQDNIQLQEGRAPRFVNNSSNDRETCSDALEISTNLLDLSQPPQSQEFCFLTRVSETLTADNLHSRKTF